MNEENLKTRILVVDDDPTIREMYKERLEISKYEVITATNGQEGLSKAVDYLPHAILLDIMMPQVNGFNTLDILKTTTETKNIPVIILTALSKDDHKKRGLDSGADDYIVKSETMPKDVIAKVEAVIRRKKENLKQKAD